MFEGQEIWSPDKAYDYLEKNKFKRGFPNDAYASPNFKWDEYVKPKVIDDSMTRSHFRNAKKTIDTLQTYRDKVFDGSPIEIRSGYRSPSYNARTPGASPTSLHKEGLAVDFKVKGYSDSDVQKKLDPIHKGKIEFAPTWTHFSLPQESDGYLQRKGITRDKLSDSNILSENIIRGFDNNYKTVKRNFNQREHDKIFNPPKNHLLSVDREYKPTQERQNGRTVLKGGVQKNTIPFIEDIAKMSTRAFKAIEKDVDEWQKNGLLKYKDPFKQNRLNSPRSWFKR